MLVRNRVGDIYRIIAWWELQVFEQPLVGSLSGKEVDYGIPFRGMLSK